MLTRLMMNDVCWDPASISLSFAFVLTDLALWNKETGEKH